MENAGSGQNRLFARSNSRASRKFHARNYLIYDCSNICGNAKKRDFKRTSKCTKREEKTWFANGASGKVDSSGFLERYEGMWPRELYLQLRRKRCKQSIKNMNRRTDINPHLDIESDNCSPVRLGCHCCVKNENHFTPNDDDRGSCTVSAQSITKLN